MSGQREPYEIERGPAALFDVFPRGTWPWLVGFLALTILAGSMLISGCGGGDPARRDRNPIDVLIPMAAAPDCPGDVVVAKGCRCRHKIAYGPKSGGGLIRTWVAVTLEDWERILEGDCWPPAAPASRPESRILSLALEAAVHDAFKPMHESLERMDAKLDTLDSRPAR